MKLQIFMIKKLLRLTNLTCLAVISLNSALNEDGDYYLQIFLQECK